MSSATSASVKLPPESTYARSIARSVLLSRGVSLRPIQKRKTCRRNDWRARSERAIRSIKTGQDAVAFFAVHGSESRVKFLRCIAPDVGGLALHEQYRPYDLIVAPPEAFPSGGGGPSEYYTVSASGVVHMMKQVQHICSIPSCPLALAYFTQTYRQ